MIIPRGIFTGKLSSLVLVIFILLFFVLIRVPGIDVPYYQDEWKNVSASAHIETAGKFFAHPPLMQMLFVVGYDIFGPDYFRVFPLLFSLASAFVLYLILKNRKQDKAALWSIVFLALCFYNFLGSLMPDVDGSILPLFFLIALYAYDKWKIISLSQKNQRIKWFSLFIISLLLGFLTKLSFIIVIGVFLLDYYLEYRKGVDFKKIFILSGIFTGFMVLYALIIYLITLIYPAFDIKIMFGHANQFVEDLGRNWIQIVIQGAKSIFYLSPLFIAPLVLGSREIFKRNRIFVIYLVLGCIFYFGVFDFSRGVLDKYLMFSIIPLCAIISDIYASLLLVNKNFLSKRSGIILGVVLSIFIFSLNFLSHEVLALYPKTLWFSRVLHGQWLMLNPFNGGSGPMGFYVSFIFIAVSFIFSIGLAFFGLYKKQYRSMVLIIIFCLGCTYNIVLAEELSFGKINGSAANVLRKSVEYILNNSNIKEVITYNDIGTRELAEKNIYAGRFYAAPQFEEVHRKKFAEYNGYYMVVGIPPLYKGFYRDFFLKCDILFETKSGVIFGNVYKCK